MDDPPIAEAVVAELERLGGDVPLLDVFVAETSNRMELLDHAVTAGELVEAGRVAHSVRGSAGSFGARRLAMLSGDLETACRAGDGPGAAALAAAMRSEFDVARRVLTARLVGSSG